MKNFGIFSDAAEWGLYRCVWLALRWHWGGGAVPVFFVYVGDWMGGGGGLAGWPFPGWGRACWLCAKSRALRVRASPSEVYPTGKLQ